jgi:hypothetical protein
MSRRASDSRLWPPWAILARSGEAVIPYTHPGRRHWAVEPGPAGVRIPDHRGHGFHGKVGASLTWKWVGVSNQHLFQIRWLRDARQPIRPATVNETG